MNKRPELPRLYPILDTATIRKRGGEPSQVARALIYEGIRLMQYRHKGPFTQVEYSEAKQIALLCKAAGAIFIMNDRADFAHLIGAGLHLGQDDLPVPAARRIIGTDPVIGFSCHNLAQVRDAPMAIDYLAIGPIFSTTSKQNPDPVLGLEQLKRVRKLTEKPLVAIGGITMENAAETLKAGADVLAVISAFFPETCDEQAVRDRAKAWKAIVES